MPVAVPYGNDNIRLFLINTTTGAQTPGNFYAFLEVHPASDV